jgi:hypothetical protein
MDNSVSRGVGLGVKLNQMAIGTTDSPVSFLLDRLEFNRGLDKTISLGLGTVIAVCCLLTAFFSGGLVAVDLFRLMLPTCFGFYALWTLLFLPLSICWSCASLHQSLLLKERYDDLLGCSLTCQEFVDQIALNTLKRCARESLKPIARLGLALVFCTLFGKTPAVDAFLWSLRACMCLLGASTALLLPLSYLCQHWSVLIHFRRNLTSLCQVFGFIGLGLFGFLVFASPLPWLTLGLGWSLSIVVFRRLAIWVCQEVPRLKRLGDTQRRLLRFRNNPWIVSWSENPVIFRERARQSRQVPLGPLGAIVFDLPMLSLFWLAILVFGVSNETYGHFWIFGVPLAIIQIMRAARSSSLATVSEVVHRTLEATSLTSLTASVFQRGWIELVALPLLVENVLIVLTIGWFSLACPLWNDGTVPGLSISVVLLVLGPLMGAIVGFYVSCSANLEFQKKKSSQITGCLMALFFLSMLATVMGPLYGFGLFISGVVFGVADCFRGARLFLEGTSTR